MLGPLWKAPALALSSLDLGLEGVVSNTSLFVADLHSLSSHNILSKYADDTTLISPQKADICITAEFSNLIRT